MLSLMYRRTSGCAVQLWEGGASGAVTSRSQNSAGVSIGGYYDPRGALVTFSVDALAGLDFAPATFRMPAPPDETRTPLRSFVLLIEPDAAKLEQRRDVIASAISSKFSIEAVNSFSAAESFLTEIHESGQK